MSKRPELNSQFKREAVALVLEHGYTLKQAAQSLGIGLSSIQRWVSQFRKEINGITPKAKAMSEQQQKIQLLEKRIRQLELEKDILKKATAVLVSGELKNIR